MKSFLKLMSIGATTLVLAGCACKGNLKGTVSHGATRPSGGQVARQGSAHKSQGKPMVMRTSDAPGVRGGGNGSSQRRHPMPQQAGPMGSMNPPPRAADGECWSAVYYPPQMQTVTERICLKEPSERFEVSPAEYEWVEERVCVKEASKQYVVQPARYETETQTILVDSGHTDWVRADENRCRASGGQQPTSDVFCAVNHPEVEKTVTVERLVQPASMREVEIPAEYQTVRRQRCVKPATNRRVEIPGEYTTVEKTVEVSPGRWEWQRVQCEGQAAGRPMNEPRVRKTGHNPGAGDNP